MRRFAVWLQGEGCRVLMGRRRWGFLSPRKEEWLGFYTMRVVQASCPEDAAREAVDMVRRELSELVRNRIDEPWQVRVEKVEEAAADVCPQLGFSWFPEEPKGGSGSS